MTDLEARIPHQHGYSQTVRPRICDRKCSSPAVIIMLVLLGVVAIVVIGVVVWVFVGAKPSSSQISGSVPTSVGVNGAGGAGDPMSTSSLAGVATVSGNGVISANAIVPASSPIDITTSASAYAPIPPSANPSAPASAATHVPGCKTGPPASPSSGRRGMRPMTTSMRPMTGMGDKKDRNRTLIYSSGDWVGSDRGWVGSDRGWVGSDRGWVGSDRG